jgi:beta-lactamase regulating signal transducer with metallopeptidase domain/biopolymer transport protein ExbD
MSSMFTLAIDSTTALAWLATFLVHSTLLCGAAWLLSRVLRAAKLRELVWRTALVGGLLTAILQTALGGGLLTVDTADLARWAERGVVREEGGSFGLIGVDAAGRSSGGAVAPSAEGVPPGTRSDSPRASGAGEPGPGRATGSALPAWIAGAWLAWAAFGLARLVRRRRRLAVALAGRRGVRRGPLVELLRRLKDERGPRRAVRLTTSPRVGSPLALGLAEICVPDYAHDLGRECHAALLAHELAHLRRMDAAWGTFAAVLARLVPFQPLFRVAERRLRAEAELLCDADAVQATGDAAGLARCLVEVAERTTGAFEPAWTAAMAAPRSEFVARVEAALQGGAPAPARGRTTATLAAGALALAALACAGPGVCRKDAAPTAGNQIALPAPDAGAPAAAPGKVGYNVQYTAPHLGSKPLLQVHVDGKLVAEELYESAEALREAIGAGIVAELARSSPLSDTDPAVELLDAEPSPRRSIEEKIRRYLANQAATSAVTLLLDDAGAIRGDDQILLPADVDDFLAARLFLARHAAAMPRAADPRSPLPPLPDGILRIQATSKTPFTRILGVMEQCGARDVLIWRLRLDLVQPDGSHEITPYNLPRDVHGVAEEVDDTRPAPTFTVEVRGDALTVVLPTPMGVTITPRPSLEQLPAQIEALTGMYPDARFVIDAYPGTVFAQVVAVLDALIDAGATDIAFVGRRK